MIALSLLSICKGCAESNGIAYEYFLYPAVPAQDSIQSSPMGQSSATWMPPVVKIVHGGPLLPVPLYLLKLWLVDISECLFPDETRPPELPLGRGPLRLFIVCPLWGL